MSSAAPAAPRTVPQDVILETQHRTGFDPSHAHRHAAPGVGVERGGGTNPEHLALIDRQAGPGFLVTNPNCVAIPLTLTLKPLHDAVGVDAVTVATY